MKTRLTKILAGLAALAALALGGAAIAGATQGGSDEPEQTLEGADADRASAAALKATGGGTVNAVERDSEKGATYEVEVRKANGSTVDVRLDGSYGVVAIDSDSEQADQAEEEDGNETGDAGQADENEEDSSDVTGADAQRVGAAALKATGGGTVNAVERDSEKGATYEVEVRKPDGSIVDVRLDGSLEVVAIDGDSESE